MKIKGEKKNLYKMKEIGRNDEQLKKSVHDRVVLADGGHDQGAVVVEVENEIEAGKLLINC